MKKAYPKYSKTRIPWLQFMPDHWDDVKVKFLFRERVEKGFPEEPLLAATQTQGVVPKELYENRTVTAQKDFHLLKLVKVGDFVISLRSFQGGIEYAYYRGIISPAYTVMKPLPEVFGGYFRYLFKSKHFVDDLTTYVTGIREGQNIDYSEFRDSFQPLPPLPEQRQIAAFLDHKCALIDTFIQKKTRLIELLKEQKQAIINKAVTKGIDPNVRLKSSGIDWLGDIPEYWEVWKLKRLCYRIGDGLHGTPEYDDNSGFLFINGNNLDEGEIRITDKTRTVTLSDFEKYNLSLREGTVLISINGTVGNLAIYSGEDIVLGKSAAFLECRKPLYNKFLFYVFKSQELINDYLSNAESTTIKNISLEALRSTRIGLPEVQEQVKISEFLDCELEKVDRTIEKIKSEIDLIQEYKTTLIAEAVTGKIDVRDWKPKQRSLPIENSTVATP